MATKVTPLKPKQQVGNRVWTLRDFINDTSIVQPDQLLAPWLCKGDLWMVYSGPGIGKTFFALNVGYAVASGGKFLHWAAKAPAKVLYVDGEMSDWDMQQRLKDLLAAAKRDRNGDTEAALNNFFGYAATSQDIGRPFPDFADAEGRQALLKLAWGKDLVVIDNLTTTMRGADPDKAMDWMPLQETLVELRKQKTAVLLVHHTNKSGDQTGTKAKEAILNGMMKLERPDDYASAEGAKFFIRWGKSRGLSGADTVPVKAQLITETNGLIKWEHVVLNDLGVYTLMRLARSGNYISQIELAKAMEVTPAYISQLKKKAINDYQLFTAHQFAIWLRAAKASRGYDEIPELPNEKPDEGPDY